MQTILRKRRQVHDKSLADMPHSSQITENQCCQPENTEQESNQPLGLYVSQMPDSSGTITQKRTLTWALGNAARARQGFSNCRGAPDLSSSENGMRHLGQRLVVPATLQRIRDKSLKAWIGRHSCTSDIPWSREVYLSPLGVSVSPFPKRCRIDTVCVCVCVYT